jgi:hypothetical protein
MANKLSDFAATNKSSKKIRSDWKPLCSEAIWQKGMLEKHIWDEKPIENPKFAAAALLDWITQTVALSITLNNWEP